MFIYFSPVWKYLIVTQERINTSFCTERGVIGHLGAHWEERQKRNAYGIFVCNGFSFIGMVSGDWHKGRGVWGRGVFWKTKAGSHSWQKNRARERERRGMREFYLSVLVKIYDLSFFLSSPCSLLPLCFLLSSHYLTKLLFPQKHPSDLWQWGIYMSTNRHRYKHTPHNPTKCPDALVVSVVSMTPFSLFLSPHLPLIAFARRLSSTPTLLSLSHLLSPSFLSFLFGIIALDYTFFPHMLSGSLS